MPLKSDISIDYSKFNPALQSEQSKKFNETLIEKLRGQKEWFEIGAPTYRSLRTTGQTAFLPPLTLPSALNITIPSRFPSRSIPCRLIYPEAFKTVEDRKKKCRGLFVHFHGGGWVLGDEKSNDGLLKWYAEAGELCVVSVGYGLCPEEKWGRGGEDCLDVAEYLWKNAEREYGCPLMFMGGESAGAHLGLLALFALMKKHSNFTLPGGLILHFGAYDLSFLPQAYHFTKPLILSQSILSSWLSALLPSLKLEERKSPEISPYYEDLEKFRGRIPAAFFGCGTEDMGLDDTVCMGLKWMCKGGEACVKVYNGACHGFIAFPGELLEESAEVRRDTRTWIRKRLGFEEE